jgi:hypothetical protein
MINLHKNLISKLGNLRLSDAISNESLRNQARFEVYRAVEGALDRGRSPPPEVMEFVKDQVFRMALSPEHSTDPVRNLLDRYRLMAWAEVIQMQRLG